MCVEQWDGDQIVAEAPIYADGTVAWDRAEAWVYEPGSFRPLAKLQGEDLYYVVTDHIGTPRELIFGWHGYRVVSDRWVPRSRQLDCVKFHGSRSSRRPCDADR